MKYFKNMTFKKWLVLVLAILFAAQAVSIFLCNVFWSSKNLDCDMAMLYVHTIEIWRSKSLLVPDWSYLTSLELDCPALLAALFFGITDNIYVAFGLANLCILGLYAWTLFRLFRGRGGAMYSLLCLNLICIPYGIGQLEYFNMTFFNGGQYGIKVLLPLMLVSIVLELKEGWSLRKLPFWLLYFVLLFISGLSSGIYVFACGIFPVLAGYVIYRLYYNLKMEKLFMVVGALSLVVTGVGFYLNHIYSAYATNARGMSMSLCSIWGIKDNVSSCFWGIFELFDAVTYTDGIAVMSYEGINILLRMLFVLFLLVCGIRVGSKCLKKEADSTYFMLLCVFLWNTFILCVCKTQYGAATFEYRYHLIGMIPLLCVAAKSLLDWYQRNGEHFRLKYMWAAVCLMALLVLNFTSYRAVLQSEKDYSDLQAICDYVVLEGVETVYFLDDTTDSEICRLLDHKNASYLFATGEGTSLAYNYYADCTGGAVEPGNAIFAADTRKREVGDTMDYLGHTLQYEVTIGAYKLYR